MLRTYLQRLVAALGALALMLAVVWARPAVAADQWAPYAAADGRWEIEYPKASLHPEDLGNGVIVFITRDRGYFVAIDSYAAAGKASPTELRARAKRTLTRIYGTAPRTLQALSQTDAPWQAGVSFATAKGSEGTAAYMAQGAATSAWGYGALYGYKVKGPGAQREMLYQTLARLQIASAPAGSPDRPSVDTLDRVAREKVATFTHLLSAGKYRAAAAHFGGDYQPLRDMNPDLTGALAGNEALQELLLKRGCTMNGYNCLRQRRILDVKVYSPDEAVVTIELTNRNGSRFVQRADGRTAFEFRVRRVAGQYLVMDLPPYTS